MNVEDVAKGLIKALGVEITKVNLAGTTKVLNTIIASINADWEEHITKDTNEILEEDNIYCEGCGTPICIRRERHILYVLNS